MNKLRVLVACEYSGRVREAFRRLGHDAWSCDLLPAEDGNPHHFQFDAVKMVRGRMVFAAGGSYEAPWDIVIAHPPCTYLANSGAKHLYAGMRKENGTNPDRWEKMKLAADFFKSMLGANAHYVAVENPVMHGHGRELVGRGFDQSIQPWQFGHMEVKRTCLWLKNLPPLVPTNNVYDEMMKLPYGERAKVHHASPGPDRWKDRSRTYAGIAEAMASQWSAHGLQRMRAAA